MIFFNLLYKLQICRMGPFASLHIHLIPFTSNTPTSWRCQPWFTWYCCQKTHWGCWEGRTCSLDIHAISTGYKLVTGWLPSCFSQISSAARHFMPFRVAEYCAWLFWYEILRVPLTIGARSSATWRQVALVDLPATLGNV